MDLIMADVIAGVVDRMLIAGVIAAVDRVIMAETIAGVIVGVVDRIIMADVIAGAGRTMDGITKGRA